MNRLHCSLERSLPLQDQVGIIDALVYIVSNAPSFSPVSDNHILAFLSELLKMISVVDGEVSLDMIYNEYKKVHKIELSLLRKIQIWDIVIQI